MCKIMIYKRLLLLMVLIAGVPQLCAQGKTKSLSKEAKISLIAGGSVLAAGAIIALVYYTFKLRHTLFNAGSSQQPKTTFQTVQQPVLKPLEDKLQHVSGVITIVKELPILSMIEQSKPIDETDLPTEKLLLKGLKQRTEAFKGEQNTMKADVLALCSEHRRMRLRQVLTEQELHSFEFIMVSSSAPTKDPNTISRTRAQCYKDLNALLKEKAYYVCKTYIDFNILAHMLAFCVTDRAIDRSDIRKIEGIDSFMAQYNLTWDTLKKIYKRDLDFFLYKQQ